MDFFVVHELDENDVFHLQAVTPELNTIGYMDCEVGDGDLNITYLYVNEDCRRSGVATGLMDYLLLYLQIHDLHPEIHMYYLLEEETESLDAFLSDRYDVITIEDCREFVISYEDCQKCKTPKQLISKGKNVTSVSKMKRGQKEIIKKALNKVNLEAPEETYDSDLSFAVFHENEPQAILLAYKAENEIVISCVYSANSAAGLLKVLGAFTAQMLAHDEKADLRMLLLNDASEALVTKIFEGKGKYTSVKSVYWL